jgi:hypothetical protein
MGRQRVKYATPAKGAGGGLIVHMARED